jgi:hypothetical protein
MLDPGQWLSAAVAAVKQMVETAVSLILLQMVAVMDPPIEDLEIPAEAVAVVVADLSRAAIHLA